MTQNYRRLNKSAVLALFALFAFTLITCMNRGVRVLSVSSNQNSSTEQVTIVVASERKDNTTWVSAAFPRWNHQIYVTDDRSAPLTVPVNKGREAMVYLTYIIDNYESLPSIIIFRHADRYQWHSDDPLYDDQRGLERLQLPYILEQGYVNLRCVWTLGCPVEIRPIKEAEFPPEEERAGTYFKAAFEEMFPEYLVPTEVGVSCCAQFAVAGWQVRRRPKTDYERYRRWLVQTNLTDDISGRILEYAWHSEFPSLPSNHETTADAREVIFGQESIFCPDAKACYCKVFGLCNLTCEERGRCESQYTLPSSLLPEGWPDYGWDGEWQNATAM